MNYTNFSIDRKTGMLVTTSKTPKEGYVENVYTVISTAEQKKNYKKSVESIEGVLKFLGMKTVKIGNNEVERVFINLQVDQENTYVLELDVFTKSRSIDDYVKALCQFIAGLYSSKGKKVNISANRTAKDKKDYLYRNIYFTVDGQKLNWDFQLYGENSPVPKAVQVPDKVTKKLKWDFSDVDAYFYEILKKYEVTTSTASAASENSQSSSESVQEETDSSPNTQDNEDFNDLPF